MSVLLKKIRNISSEAARVLEREDLCTDLDIQSLTREDLHDLFPGPGKFKLRRTIFEIIHEQKPIDVVLRELKAFIPHESFRANVTSNGVLVDYLRILKDMKTQMNYVQHFLDAHIDLLEEFSQDQPHQKSDKDSLPGIGTSGASGPMGPIAGHSHPHRAQDSLPGIGTSGASGPMGPIAGHSHSQGALATVIYQMVVSGVTFRADQQLMYKVESTAPSLVQFVKGSENHQITIVFCPNSSRIGSDVQAAMSDVKDDKPIILVLMHHTREPKYTYSKTWDYSKVVLHVNIFYHETANGLLTCQQNNVAVTSIRDKLLEYAPRQQSQHTSGNAHCVGAESVRTGSTPRVVPPPSVVRGVGISKGSDVDVSGSFWFWKK